MGKKISFKKLNSFLFITAFLITSILVMTCGAEAKKTRDTFFRIRDNMVSAYKLDRSIVKWYPKIIYQDSEKSLWDISFPSIKGKNKLLGPTAEIDGKVYFAYYSYVMELDLEKAQFVNRYQVLGEITDIKEESGKLVIKTFNGIRGQVWDKEPTLKLTPKQLEIVSKLGSITNRDYLNAHIKIKDAELLSKNVEKIHLYSLVSNKLKDVNKLELLRQEYLKATEADTTNPWYYIYLAVINDDLDKKIYSEVYYKKSLEVSGLCFFDYFQLSTFFEYMGKTDLADISYDRGMSDFFGRQYTPEQLTSLQSFLNYSNWLVPTIEKLKKENNSRRLLILVDRFQNLSPLKEGNFNILSGVSNYLVGKGQLQESRAWQSKVEDSKGFLFPSDYSFIIADLSLNFLLASIISFMVFLIILIIRVVYEFLEDSKHNKIYLKEILRRRYISKRTIYSFVLLYAFAVIALGLCNNTIASISNILKEPPTINSGTWGNYATIKYFSKEIGKTQEKDFFLALSNQQIKDYQTAITLYEKIDTSEAHNNLGVVYIKQGKKTLAIDEFNRALEIEKDMTEAKYNLALLDKTKESGEGSKVELMKKYAPNLPMISLPPDKYYKKAFYKNITIQDFNPANILFFTKFTKDTGNVVIEATQIIVPIFIFFTLSTILLLTLVFVPQTHVLTANRNYVRRLLGLFVPGFSYNWNLLGPFIFAFWLGLGITLFFYFGFSFEKVKPTIGLLTTYGLPDYSKIAPDISYDLAFSKEVGLITSVSFSMIWLFNFFYIMISKRFVQD